MNPELMARAARIRMLLMDVDGVLTNAKLYNVPGPDGKMWETKGFDAQDGIALQWMSWYGIETGVISGRVSPAVEERARLYLHILGNVKKAELPKTRLTRADPRVDAVRGCVAIERQGDRIYCDVAAVAKRAIDRCRDRASV